MNLQDLGQDPETLIEIVAQACFGRVVACFGRVVRNQMEGCGWGVYVRGNGVAGVLWEVVEEARQLTVLGLYVR